MKTKKDTHCLIVAAALKRCKELLFSVCGVEIVCCEF